MKGYLAVGGIFLTFVYCAAAGWLMQDRLISLPELQLNEIGDFLAGVFSPLAFLWLVLGFLQQGQELGESRKALLLQAAELKNSVEQQKSLVEVSNRQLEAEIEAREAERLRQVMAAQPKLSIKREAGSLTQGVVKSEFVLKNSGHQITNLLLKCDNSLDLKLPKLVPVFDNSETLRFPIEKRQEDIQNFLLEVFYIDGMGIQQNTTFIFSRSEEGGFPQYSASQVTGKIVSA